jgi:hypothetical protein
MGDALHGGRLLRFVQLSEAFVGIGQHAVTRLSARARLAGHVETLKAQLAAAETRAEGLKADLMSERARTSAAISAFASLADRLDALAEARARPWWRRLVG